MLGLRSDSDFKDKLSLISLILILILGVVFVLIYFFEDFETAKVLMYPLGLCFLIWFATRRNGCGSCNQVSRQD